MTAERPNAARLLGEGYVAGAAAGARAFRGCGARYSPRPSVWEVGAVARRTDGTASFELGVLQDGSARMVYARCVIVATGARERTVPAPGGAPARRDGDGRRKRRRRCGVHSALANRLEGRTNLSTGNVTITTCQPTGGPDNG